MRFPFGIRHQQATTDTDMWGGTRVTTREKITPVIGSDQIISIYSILFLWAQDNRYVNLIDSVLQYVCLSSNIIISYIRVSCAKLLAFHGKMPVLKLFTGSHSIVQLIDARIMQIDDLIGTLYYMVCFRWNVVDVDWFDWVNQQKEKKMEGRQQRMTSLIMSWWKKWCEHFMIRIAMLVNNDFVRSVSAIFDNWLDDFCRVLLTVW